MANHTPAHGIYERNVEDGGTSAGGAPPLGVLNMLAAALALVVPLAVSSALHLGIEWKMVVSSVRCAVQLTVLGYILKPVFDANNPYVVVLFIALMVTAAAGEACTSRLAYVYDGVFMHTLAAIACAGTFTGAWAVTAVTRTGLDVHVAIPVMGMLLGNATSACAVALSRLLTELKEGASVIEAQLALGASRWEAVADTVRDAASLGLTPTLNALAIMGLVSIPGAVQLSWRRRCAARPLCCALTLRTTALSSRQA